MRIEQKWGFGMAPPHEETQLARNAACKNLKLIVEEKNLHLSTSSLAEISMVKGMFTRIWKQDQWD